LAEIGRGNPFARKSRAHTLGCEEERKRENAECGGREKKDGGAIARGKTTNGGNALTLLTRTSLSADCENVRARETRPFATANFSAKAPRRRKLFDYHRERRPRYLLSLCMHMYVREKKNTERGKREKERERERERLKYTDEDGEREKTGTGD